MINNRLTQFKQEEVKKNNHSSFVVDLRPLSVVESPKVKLKKADGVILKKAIFKFKFKKNKDKKARHNFQKKFSPNLINFNYQELNGNNFNLAKYLLSLVRRVFSLFRRERVFRNKLWQQNYFFLLNEFENTLNRGLKDLRKKLKKPFKIKNLFSRRKSNLELKLWWYRSIFSFTIILILLIVPFKVLSYFEFFNFDLLEKKILDNSKVALSSLLAAGDAVERQDWQGADQAFQAAANNFLSAQGDLNQINDSILSLAALINDPKYKLAAESKKFIEAGVIISSLGRNLVLASDNLFNENEKDFSKRLNGFIEHGNLAVTEAEKLQKDLQSINVNNLPLEYQDQFILVKKQANFVIENLKSFVSSARHLENILGVSQDKRYLLVFQNNSELRASGGFIGSYALVDVREGKIKNLEIPGGGSYDTEGAMSFRMAAPRPLWLINPLWHFWDANWWPDWPKTARNLMWFYENSGGSTVDGVISLTPDVIEDLLLITGPISFEEEYGLTISSDNFWETTQLIVERNNIEEVDDEIVLEKIAVFDNHRSNTPLQTEIPLEQGLELNSDNKPKKIIGDLAIRILETLPNKLDKNNLLKIVALFEKNLAAKNILFYFNDENLQAEVSQRNWSGEVKDAPDDYLMVVNTNIAGQKSDRMMEEIINHESVVSLDGSIINTVTIKRLHKGVKNELFTGVRNVDWMRIYVPLGSELISAQGFISPETEYLQDRPEDFWQEHDDLLAENNAQTDALSKTLIYEENSKTVFANWLMVDPGEEQIVIIKYRLPFNFYKESSANTWWDKFNNIINPESGNLQTYSLLVQKQAGAKPSYFSSNLVLNQSHKIIWSYPEGAANNKGWLIGDALTADKYWSILLEKNN